MIDSVKDPILYHLSDYHVAREASRVMRRSEYESVLELAADVCPEIQSFCAAVSETIQRLSEGEAADGIDPYYSTSLEQWVAALSRGLKWVESGADPGFLKYYADADAFLSDVASEFPPAGQRADSVPFVGFWVQPAEAIANSPRLRARVIECLPNFPGPLYATLEAHELAAIASQFERALETLRNVDRTAHEAILASVSTAFIALHQASVKVSFGTRADCFGTMVAGLSRERLKTDNLAAQASQLYHEHCHLKLALYLDVEEPALDPDAIFVSPFKNEARDLETILHTAYTLSIECLTRLALARDEGQAQRERTLAYLAAVAARLEITGEIAAKGLRDSDPAPLRRIPSLASEAVQAIAHELESVSRASRDLHEKERHAVRSRHSWDIGQFLVRGVPIVDPRLDEDICVADETVRFKYDGRSVTARLETPKPSIGDYGRYVEAVL